LPEPLLVDTNDASADLVLAESVSMAMMVVLETLSPDERAVFVLREVFGFSHDEIASAIGKSSASVRQLAHRAREHVQARRRRFDPVDPQRSMELTTQFFATAATGDVDALIALLAPNVVWTADSDGKASAARRPVAGAKRVARLILGLLRFAGDEGRVEPSFYNGAPALVLYLGDSLEGIISVELTDGKISHFYAMRNPEKLGGVMVEREISR
jgi:RNA polymerase sigma-70 factor (ECF subfamily)